ncbi:MAG: hypothetical protein ACMG6S_33405 [Byssovorax sp.]
MKAEIETRFAANLERVQHLVDAYQGAAVGPGRRPVETTDVLRAAVVFLHATLEDFLRSLLEWKLPLAAAVHIKDIPLAGKKPRSTFTLDDLAPFRGTSVDDLIARSVMENLERSNFNDPGEVEGVLERIGLPKVLLDAHRDKLGPMMKRRHWIVHRADRNTAAGRGHHAARALQQAAVEAWRDALKQFGADVMARL